MVLDSGEVRRAVEPASEIVNLAGGEKGFIEMALCDNGGPVYVKRCHICMVRGEEEGSSIESVLACVDVDNSIDEVLAILNEKPVS